MDKKSDNIDDLTGAIFLMINSLQNRVKKICSCEDFVSPIRLRALSYVKEKRTPLMKDVADFLLITRPSATSLINGLVKAGYLARIADKNDRRAIRLTITEKGRHLLEKGNAQIKKHIREILTVLSDKEREAMIKIYKKLSNKLSK